MWVGWESPVIILTDGLRLWLGLVCNVEVVMAPVCDN